VACAPWAFGWSGTSEAHWKSRAGFSAARRWPACSTLPSPTIPVHAIWKRDFGRSTGLFGLVLRGDEQAAKRFLNALKLVGLGFSWGGFESLAVLGELEGTRTVRPWREGPVVRLHIGLEDVADLLADLELGFAAMAGS
jgi:cystathionine beta-lyase